MNDFLRIDKGTKKRGFTLKINESFFIKSIFAILFFSTMTYLSFENYLLFHGIIEILCILVALMIFTIVANTNGFYKNAAISIVGVSFGVVAMIDGLHTLAYKGMGVFVGYGADLPTQMWIISRYVNSISIFLALILFRKNLKYKNVIIGYGLVCIFLFITIFKLNIFPSCFVEGSGLTPFKIYSEYTLCIIYLANMFILYKKKAKTNTTIFKYLQTYLIFSIIAELCFTLYIDVYGFSNVIGHHFKLLAFYCIYKSLVEVNIKAPYTALQQSENRYRMFFETSPNGILLNCKDKILLTNPCFLKMFNYSIDSEVIGKSLLKFIHPDEIGRLKVLNEALTSQEVVEGYETKFLKEDGTEIYAELSIMPYNCEMGECVFIMIKDITAQKLSEKLKEEVEQKTLFNNLQRDFFTNLSHELKTPINLIFSTVQLMESKVKNDIVNIKEMGFNKHSYVLKQNCYRMLKLISNLIDITKIDTGFLKLSLKNADIISIVEDITLSTAEYIESKGISLVFDTDIEERIMATDANMIERIILNLLSNAIKFTDSGGEITVGIMDKETSIIISVKDTGVGIPKEKLDEIFGRFNQVDQTLSRNARGSGIGLALVHSLVKMHGGIIFAVSEPGKGSDFIIELPVRLVAQEDGETFIDIQGKERYVDMMNIEFSDIYS